MLPRIVSLPAPPSMVSLISAARLPVAEKESLPPLALSTRFSERADVDGERRRVETVEPHPGPVRRGREHLGAVAAIDLNGVVAGAALVQVGVIAGVPDHPVVVALAEHLVVGVAADEDVVLGPPEQEVGSALTEQRVVAGLPEEHVTARPTGDGVVAAAGEHVGPGSAPDAWLRVIVSLPPRPNTWIRATLATVGVPPRTGTAPPLTRISPAALRLIWMLLSRLSPSTLSTPLDAENCAVTAALADWLRPKITPAPITPPTTSRRAKRHRRSARSLLTVSSWGSPLTTTAAAHRFTASCVAATVAFARHQRQELRFTVIVLGPSVHTLKVSLRHVEPTVWRRIVVPSATKLTTFARWLEAAMGWDGYHLHSFSTGELQFGPPDEDADGVIDERRVTLKDILPRADSTLQWDYDFGDGWEHDVEVEAIEESSTAFATRFASTGRRPAHRRTAAARGVTPSSCAALADPTHPDTRTCAAGSAGLRRRPVRRGGCQSTHAGPTMTSDDANGSLDDLVERAEAAGGAEDWDAAVDGWRAVLAHPDAIDELLDYEILDEIHRLLRRAGRHDEAIAAKREAIAAGYRSSPDPEADIAEVLVEAGRREEADALYAELRRRDPDDVWLYNSAGFIYAGVDDARRCVGALTASTWRSPPVILTRSMVQLLDMTERLWESLGQSPDEDLIDRVEAFRRSWRPPARRLPRWAEPESGAGPTPMPLALAWFPADQWPVALERWPDLTTTSG